MSRYEWEKGTLILPAKAYRPLKQALLAHWNQCLEHDLAVLERLHEATRLRCFQDKTQPVTHHLSQELQRETSPSSRYSQCLYVFKVLDDYQAHEFLVKKSEKGPRLVRPTRKALPWATRATHSLQAGYEGHLSFDDDRRQVTWSVGQNNHAIDDARGSPIGAEFFRQLRQVQWCRGTGGAFVGNDEYNQDDDNAGGGGNYLKDCFGPLGQAERSPVQRPSRSSRTSAFRR